MLVRRKKLFHELLCVDRAFWIDDRRVRNERVDLRRHLARQGLEAARLAPQRVDGVDERAGGVDPVRHQIRSDVEMLG